MRSATDIEIYLLTRLSRPAYRTGVTRRTASQATLNDLQRLVEAGWDYTNPANRARWFIGFAGLELSTMSVALRAHVNETFHAMVLTALSGSKGRKRQRPHNPGYPSEELAGVQRAIRSGFRMLTDAGRWTVPSRTSRELIAFPSRRYMVFTRGNYRKVTILNQVLDTLADPRARFDLCPECRQPFVAVRRQRYCARRCSQAKRTRKYRAEHREELRDKRLKGYERKQRALDGGQERNVRINRRAVRASSTGHKPAAKTRRAES
jgi:hypothetical protein